MLRFRLGHIPVEVHFSHWIFSAILAFGLAAGPHPNGWPGRILLSDPRSPEHSATYALVVGGWMAIVFLSVLTHEMGHALVSRLYGYQPAVHLMWMGGHTQPNPNETIPWYKDVLLTLAGPIFGLLLGLSSRGILEVVGGHHEVSDYFLENLFLANLTWTVLNLVPVSPLDGGRISDAVLTRVFGPRGFLFSQVVAVTVSVAAVAVGVWLGAQQNLFLVVVFASFAFRALSLIAAYFRGEAPHRPMHPAEQALVQAIALFKEGKRNEARSTAQAVVDTDVTPVLRSRAHHLLGWIALKEGQGRAALDHFSQVQGEPIEPQALAAAFSLVGDESRAVPLWETAYRATPDPTILHEWAGALLRDGREDRVRTLPGVNWIQAYHCATRTLFLRGAFLEAARLGAEALERVPSAELAYDAACAYAKAHDRTAALKMLERAQELGFTDVDYATTDDDLASLHADPPFSHWVKRLRESAPR